MTLFWSTDPFRILEPLVMVHPTPNLSFLSQHSKCLIWKPGCGYPWRLPLPYTLNPVCPQDSKSYQVCFLGRPGACPLLSIPKTTAQVQRHRPRLVCCSSNIWSPPHSGLSAIQPAPRGSLLKPTAMHITPYLKPPTVLH